MTDNGKAKPGRHRGRRRSVGLRKHQPVDGVVVEETFQLFDGTNSKEPAGEGVYISATTSNNKRYYGVLIDQPALKIASNLYFKDQSDSLKLNERMKLLLQQKNEKEHSEAKLSTCSIQSTSNLQNGVYEVDTVRVHVDENSSQIATSYSLSGKSIGSGEPIQTKSHPNKKARLEDLDTLESDTSGNAITGSAVAERPVQKLKYVSDTYVKSRRSGESESGYRILVATFSSIVEAACGDSTKVVAIRAACEDGGNFIASIFKDPYYYQYEVLPSSLTAHEGTPCMLGMMRTSMGFNSFLQNTLLPPWYPLSNLHSQAKVLSMMNMKRDNKGNVKWEGNGGEACTQRADAAILEGGTVLPMQPRQAKQYLIGVIGGGIAGLACCEELATLLNNDGIDARVTLLEARSRLGGRLFTDRSWSFERHKHFPLELGAAWIHGINDNPLAALAKQSGNEFVTASEDVKMLDGGLREVDSEMDERMGNLFDALLDHAAGDCWNSREDPENTRDNINAQKAVRWYASAFTAEEPTLGAMKSRAVGRAARATCPPPHRSSNDRSLDCEIGKAIATYRFREFANLTEAEHRMLQWNIKNVEYAIGANLNMMSTKYWDVDDRHAFEGEHVLLRDGYSIVVEHMYAKLQSLGASKFECFLDFPVGKIEYGRKSAAQAFGRDRFGRDRPLADLSDTCSVTSEDGKITKFFDFLVCAVPLGVLKETISRKDSDEELRFCFRPNLPFDKVDAIANVGFGLLDKVYIRFALPFWRTRRLFAKEEDCLFGNVSGVHSHHYMFFDVGRRFGTSDDAPAILMSLVSGNEAVAMEWKSDDEIVGEVIETLQAIFAPAIDVPSPVDVKVTRWGRDRFARGSYTYLPPGSTDQDYQLLQSPINVNGDSILLEGSEIMRLFFAGEHTTALHPSTAHGAMLSGIRAAQEVVTTIQGKNTDTKDVDRVIPVSIYRHQNPTSSLRCHLCHKEGGQVRQGALLAFKRGARQVLVHNNCAEFCPEVEVVDAKWRNVIRAVNRGKNFTCEHCSLSGSTIGCSADNCWRSFHFACAEDCGWRFERDGKHFLCDLHRKVLTKGKDCDRISLKYFEEKNPNRTPFCAFCGEDQNDACGELLSFQSGRRQTCAHLNCVKFTSLVDTTEIAESRIGNEFQNVFEAILAAKVCTSCQKPGATIGCSNATCTVILHFSCAAQTNWNFEKHANKFLCLAHRMKSVKKRQPEMVDDLVQDASSKDGGFKFKHNLLSLFGVPQNGTIKDVSTHVDVGGTVASVNDPSTENGMDEESESDESLPGYDVLGIEVMDIPLATDLLGPKQLVRLQRPSRDEFWNVSLKFEKVDGSNLISVASVPPDNDDLFSLQKSDILYSINGSKIGSGDLQTLRDVLFHMKQEVDMMLQVIRK